MSNHNNPILSDLVVSLKKALEEVEENNFSDVDFAVQIWKGAILGIIPEKTLVSILFEKAAKVTPEESYRMISDLTIDTLLGKEEAIRRALFLIVEGL